MPIAGKTPGSDCEIGVNEVDGIGQKTAATIDQSHQTDGEG